MSKSNQYAVLMDAGAVFFAVRDLFEGLQLEYPALADVLCKRVLSQSGQMLEQPKPSLRPDSEQLWALWTSFSAQNAGQARFLDYAENKLGWIARRFDPSDSYVVDPQTTLGISKSSDGGNSRSVNRLMRFDASIAYTVGRIAKTHLIVLITDSYALAEPLVKAAMARGQKNCIAFFGRLLDPRWHGLLRGKAQDFVEFIDLDDAEAELFGERRSTGTNMWEDRFPIE